MITLRTNLNSARPANPATGAANESFAAMVRLDARRRAALSGTAPSVSAAVTGGAGQPPGGNGPAGPGDIIYGARKIALFLFNDASDTARRRVFCLWVHYRDRNEQAGFFKLKGALCLSISQWRAFHGL